MDALFRLYKTYRQKILFLVVGGWNTLLTYGIFSLCWYLLGEHLHPTLVLLITYLISSVPGFIAFRYLVFGPASHPVIEYLRYQLVYVPLLAINMVALPLILKHTGINAYLAQMFFVCFAVIVSYLGNRFFVFKGTAARRESEPQPPKDTFDTGC